MPQSGEAGQSGLLAERCQHHCGNSGIQRHNDEAISKRRFDHILHELSPLCSPFSQNLTIRNITICYRLCNPLKGGAAFFYLPLFGHSLLYLLLLNINALLSFAFRLVQGKQVYAILSHCRNIYNAALWDSFAGKVTGGKQSLEILTGENMGMGEAIPQSAAGLVGWHFIYIYDNGWRYEIYIKNSGFIDYRIHSGMVGGRWVRNQPVRIAALSKNIFRISWDEPTGTIVSLVINLRERAIHCFACFPRWIKEQPQKTVCFQNDYLDLMRRCRDEGSTYPHFIVDEWANITFMENCGADNEEVINCAPADLPAGYVERVN